MLGSNGLTNVELRAKARGVARWGTFCSALAVLVFATGCPLIQPTPCTDDASCNDGNGCTTDTCDVDTGLCSNTAACADDHCVDDACVECIADSECDDSDACTVDACGDDGACTTSGDTDCDDGDACTDDTCDSATGCVNTDINCDDSVACTDDACDAGTCTHTDNCAAGSACNETTGQCVLACDSAEICDDGDACTTDACVNNACSNTPLDCDDSVACTDDACDAGVCTHTDNCTAPQTCNETTGLCEEAPICTVDADCDDGVFCNGTETCDVATGNCVAGTRPCDDGGATACADDGSVVETCAEGDTAAVCTPCPSPTLDFTLNQDNLTGTTGDDIFSAPLEFVPSSGNQVATLQVGDIANGLAGTDTLNATFNTNGLNVVPSLSGIEVFNLTAFDDVTINGTSITGATTINSVNSVDDITFNALGTLVDAGITNLTTAGKMLSLVFQTGSASPTTGSADEIDLTLSGTTTGTFNITTAANGFETLNAISNGGVANSLTAITQTTGTSMTRVNVTGSANLTINTIPNTALTVAASTFTGGLQLGTGTTAATYAGFASAANNMTDIDTGTGNDTLIFGTQFNTNDLSSATADLGAGTDVVQATFAADYGTSMPFRNTEEFRFNCTTAATVNMTSITGLATLTNDSDGGATAITLQNVPATSGVFPTLNFRGDNTQAAQTYDTITYSATGNTGSSDVLNINVANRGTALNSGSATTNVHTMGAITAAGFETVNVDVADGPATFGGITASTMINFDADASSNLTLGTVGPTSAVLVSIDCSGVTGNLSATFDWLTSGATLTAGGGNDTITIGTNSTGTTLSVTLGAGNDTFTGDTDTDCADTVNAGAGADTINAGPGNDTITTGDGSDTVLFNQFTASDREDISDFTAGAGGDVMKFDISDLQLASGTEYVGVIGSLAVNSSETIVILTAVGYATDEAAEDAVAGRVTTDGADMVIIYFNTGDNTTHICQDPDAGVDGAATVKLIGKLTNITTQAAHDTLTTANIDSQS